MSDFAKRLNHLMAEKNITQNKLSKMTGITQSSISDWANGKYKPRQDKVYQLSKALKVSPAYLLGYTDNENIFDDISSADNELLNLYDKLNSDGQEKVLNYTQDLVDSGKYSTETKPTVKEMIAYLQDLPLAGYNGNLNIHKMNEEELYTYYKLIKDNE